MSGRLFFLNLSAGRVLSAKPDGLALDVVAGHIYWTNMGDPKRQHYVEEIAEPHNLWLASNSDIFMPTGGVKVGVVWDLSVKKVDADTCEFTNAVHSSFTPELLDSLARQGIPKEVFQAARKPVSKAHNRQETPLFTKSIERHALSGTPFAVGPQEV